MTKIISIGIIGTGFGKVIAQNFKAVDPSIKIYFSGRSKEKLETVANEVSADGVYSTWQELILDPKIDFVVIASYSGAHKEMFEFAAKAGKNILVEKPAALLSSEIDEMIKSVTDKSTIIAVNHEGRFHPVISYLKGLIESGKLGSIMTLRIGAYLNWYSNPEYVENWGNNKDLGGGQIFSVGTHQIDLARYLLNNPLINSGSVQGISFPNPKFSKDATGDSQFVAYFKTDSNTSIQLYNDCYCFGYKDFTIEIIGSNGIVLYSDQRGLKTNFSNSAPMDSIEWHDPMPEITLGNSLVSKSMKYMAKALIESIKTGKSNHIFCSLQDEKENLKLFEKYEK